MQSTNNNLINNASRLSSAIKFPRRARSWTSRTAFSQRSKKWRGFTLIEIMISVAIVAIVAAIGVPSYLKYATRARVSEGMLILDGIRLQIETQFSIDGYVDPAKVVIQTENLGKYVDRAGIDYYNTEPGADGGAAGGGTAIWVRYGNYAPEVSGRCINLIPQLGGEDITFVHPNLTPIAGSEAGEFLAKISQIVWDCRTAFVRGVDFNFLPASCRSTNTAHTTCPTS